MKKSKEREDKDKNKKDKNENGEESVKSSKEVEKKVFG